MFHGSLVFVSACVISSDANASRHAIRFRRAPRTRWSSRSRISPEVQLLRRSRSSGGYLQHESWNAPQRASPLASTGTPSEHGHLRRNRVFPRLLGVSLRITNDIGKESEERTSVGTKLRDHKMLWGRANGQCAICRTPLARINELGHSSILGEEAHIVAREPGGPRGKHDLPLDKRDEYSNLILLCPTHHTEIDEVPAGVANYPVERLIKIKEDHEKLMRAASDMDPLKQSQEEQWAGLIDQVSERFGWDDWEDNFIPIFHGEGPAMRKDLYDRLHAAIRWVYVRVWPSGNDELRETIQTMALVANDLLQTFEKHVDSHQADSQVYYTDRFYKIREWNPKLYHSLLAEYNAHVSLVHDLSFELTRYGNLVAEIVRATIDPSYRFEEGALVVRSSDFITWQMFRPEFSAEERDGGQPYTCLNDFITDRYSRAPHTVPDEPTDVNTAQWRRAP